LRSSKVPAVSTGISINKKAYEDWLRGFWLGSCIANWTGLPTENARTSPPFFTDANWQTPSGHNGAVLDYVLNNDPWGADDDTDIEYVYQHAMEKYDNHMLTPVQISKEWKSHIGLPLLWVSNLSALGQMQNGVLPPQTSLPEMLLAALKSSLKAQAYNIMHSETGKVVR
jgi:hypothetical protein